MITLYRNMLCLCMYGLCYTELFEPNQESNLIILGPPESSRVDSARAELILTRG